MTGQTGKRKWTNGPTNVKEGNEMNRGEGNRGRERERERDTSPHIHSGQLIWAGYFYDQTANIYDR